MPWHTKSTKQWMFVADDSIDVNRYVRLLGSNFPGQILENSR